MLRSLPVATLLALCLALAACRTSPRAAEDPGYPPLEVAELGAMHNVSRSGEVWFGGAPGDADLDLAARRGMVRVIDLSTTDEAVECDVAAVCREQGIEYLDPGRDERELLRGATVDLVLHEIVRANGKPVLLFDGNGARSAAFVAIYRVVRQNVPLEVALVEARRAGMKPGAPETFVREQVERLRTPVTP